MTGCLPTRWWSWGGGGGDACQVMQQFGQRRLQVADDRAATLTQIEEMLTDPLCNASLQIELAAVVDAGTRMVQSTYILEGNGTLAWEC